MALEIALMIVGALISVMAVVSGAVSLWLTYKYFKYNRRANSLDLTGLEIARKILDDHGLQNIKVKRTGSLLFGNCYSHYFKAVRLRGFIRHETSLTSIGLGAQKAALAILDKEGDPDMIRRVRLTPFITFGPYAFIPLLTVGIALDYFVFSGNGICSIVFGSLGILFYAYSVMLSVLTLKTEKKAQDKAHDILQNEYNLTDDELAALRDLFRLYNIQYVNDIILASLELIYAVLQIAIAVNNQKD